VGWPYVHGALVWRSRSADGSRIRYTDRLPFWTRLLLLGFFPHAIMAVGMLLFGLFVLVTWPFGVLNDPPPLVGGFLVFMGAIFTPPTLILQFGRTTVVIDKRKGAAIETFGLKLLPWIPLVPLGKRRRFPIPSFESIRLDSPVPSRRGRLGCKVLLFGKDPGAIKLAECVDLGPARRLAEELSDMLALPIEDRTGSAPGRRSPEELDLPLMLRPHGAPPVEPPASTIAQYSVTESRFTATLARPPFRPLKWPLLLLLCILFVALGAALDLDRPSRPEIPERVEFSPNDPPPPSLWPWRVQLTLFWISRIAPVLGWVGGALSVLVMACRFLFRRPNRALIASSDGIRLDSNYFFVRWSRSIPAVELEELRVDGSEEMGWVLAAVSDRRIIRFGHGLTRDELAYARDLARRAVKG
jgi:hypothetical protein